MKNLAKPLKSHGALLTQRHLRHLLQPGFQFAVPPGFESQAFQLVHSEHSLRILQTGGKLLTRLRKLVQLPRTEHGRELF